MAFEYAPLIEKYGYVATFAGSVIEGETLLILSGLAAHRGYLSFALVVVAGALGGALGDMALFLLGRHYGNALIARFPRFAPAAEKVHAMIERFPSATILAVRFMYGLRTAGPAIIGTTRVPFLQFALLNALGALGWSACWAGAGYVVGRAAEHLLGDLARIERELFGAAIVVVVLGAVAYHVWRAREQKVAMRRSFPPPRPQVPPPPR
jgi:membrane protein DedA with SNARE-associated domain